MRNIVALIVATLVLSSICYPQSRNAAKEESVFRGPFTLKLHVDKEHYYEQAFDHVPYVSENEVYVFAGEAFGINVIITENRLSGITYQRDPAKADVALAFTQESSAHGWVMLLVIQNRLKRKLYLDALMTIPEKREILKTSVLPVEPNLSDFESWPHPIVQLVLRNFRFSEKPKQSDGQEKPKDETETVDPMTGDLHLTIPIRASTKKQ